MNLNQNAATLCDRMAADAEQLRVAVHAGPLDTRIIDCGVNVPGGLAAGLLAAEICMGGLGTAKLISGPGEMWRTPGVCIQTDHPLGACLASQYAGWKVDIEGYRALASGPMRAGASIEHLYKTIGRYPREGKAVGFLAAGAFPSEAVCEDLAGKCRVSPHALTLLVAPPASMVGMIVGTARSVEAAMANLLDLEFDARKVEAAFGVAPLPPVAASDTGAMGRTHDAIRYGGEVTLWLRGSEQQLATLVDQMASDGLPEYEIPFTHLYRRHHRDLHAIDLNLLGPASITMFNLETGRSIRAGQTMPDALQRSFTRRE